MYRSLLVSIFLVACVPQVSLGERCARNSDCPAPYACLVGRCAEECRTQADCTFPGRCVSILGVSRCFYDDRSFDQCTSASDCGGDSSVVCRSGGCYNSCERCAALGAVCVDDVCMRTETADAGPTDDAGADAGRDGGGAPVFEPHRPCSAPADCPGGVCASDDGAAPVCRQACVGPVPDAGTPTPDDPECASRTCVRPAGSTTEAYCALTCDPLAADACPAGDTCDVLARNRPTTGDYREVWGCRRVATVGVLSVDGPCDSDTADLCPAGTHCTNDGALSYCHELCNPSLPCRDGRECARIHTEPEQYIVGTCMFPSMM